MRDKTAGSESPEQVVYDLALYYGVGEYITKTTAAIGFLDQLAGEQIPVLQRFRGQYVKAYLSHLAAVNEILA
jgi:hypothetical protein